jgi:phosphotransferase system HPr (HPr) family protein
MAETTLTVTHSVGLHARPASLFVKEAVKFHSKITVMNITSGKKTVDAKSIISVLSLGVQKDHQILITAEGDDADDALKALTALVASNFGEV